GVLTAAALYAAAPSGSPLHSSNPAVTALVYVVIALAPPVLLIVAGRFAARRAVTALPSAGASADAELAAARQAVTAGVLAAGLAAVLLSAVTVATMLL